MRYRHYLNLIPLLLLVPTGTDARIIRIDNAQTLSPDLANLPEPPAIWRYTCDVERVLPRGAIRLSRLYTDEGKLDGGDFMHWNHKGYDPSRPGRPLNVELSYIWEPQNQPAIAPREINIPVRVGLDTDLPEVAWLQIQRPFPVKPHGIIDSSALSSQVFPYAAYDKNNGHGELPLGDLLAYAEGYDALDWALVRPSDRLGADKEFARGKPYIAAFREALAALPALRKALAKKTAAPKTQCKRSLWPNHILY